MPRRVTVNEKQNTFCFCLKKWAPLSPDRASRILDEEKGDAARPFQAVCCKLGRCRLPMESQILGKADRHLARCRARSERDTFRSAPTPT